MEADFSGYATRNGLKCSDGRTILADAFKHQDQMTVPLVWQHVHNDPDNVLGHAVLENRPDGVYAYAFFNDSNKAKQTKTLVQHGDVKSLSIFANSLVQRGLNVIHGMITEVSVVLAGANPGAFIDNVSLQHGELYETLDDEAIIYTGLEIEHALTDVDVLKEEEEEEVEVDEDETIAEVFDTFTDEQKNVAYYLIGEALSSSDEGDLHHAVSDGDPDEDEETIQDVFNTLSEKQKNVVYFMIGEALAEAEEKEKPKAPKPEPVSHSDNPPVSESKELTTATLQHAQEGITMPRNVFEQYGSVATAEKPKLTPEQFQTIVADAQKMGSFKDSVLAHAADYGIEDVDILFPDARTIEATPEFLARRTEWVTKVLSATRHSPFSRIKSIIADITADEARAKGYVKGNLKKEEIIKLLKRVTTPTTVYKKQKMDREDIVDITSFDVVAWLKAEMRLLLDEELARAILVGDGREADDEDKIDEEKLRPVAYDNDMYTTSITLSQNATPSDTVDAVITAMSYYKGTGQPTFYTTIANLTNLLIQKDTLGRRIYASIQELADALLVKEIVPVEAMEINSDVYGIIVNLTDYTVGADNGGDISFFDFFDIDYNQQKYLIETRVSGALTKPKSAVAIFMNPGTTVTPQSPSFDGSTNTITIPTVAGVNYLINGNIVTGNIVITQNTDVSARPQPGSSFPKDTVQDWTFTYTAPSGGNGSQGSQGSGDTSSSNGSQGSQGAA